VQSSGEQSPFSMLDKDQLALEPAIVLSIDSKGDGTGSSDSAMIAVLAGTDTESDVANSGTVRINSDSDAEGSTKLLRVIIYSPPHLSRDSVCGEFRLTPKG